MRNFDAELLEGQHLRQMTKRTNARMPNPDRLARLLHPAQQLVEIVRRQCWPSRQRNRSGIDEANGDEILLGVERAVLIKRHARRECVLMQQDGVAVGLRTRGFGCTDHPASTTNVFDDDWL